MYPRAEVVVLVYEKYFWTVLSVWKWYEISFTGHLFGSPGLVCSARMISLLMTYEFRKQVIYTVSDSDTKSFPESTNR